MSSEPVDSAQRTLRQWAARQLGLPADVTRKAVQADFLRRLPAEEFVPPACWQQALGVLTDRPVDAGLGEQAAWDDEESLREQVEAFAVQFFQLDPEHRTARWRDLSSRCAALPPLRLRLHLLGQALDLDVRGGNSKTRTGKLAGFVAELFVLRPASRARRRAEILQECQRRRSDWKVAAVQLRGASPRIANLDPVLVRELMQEVGNWLTARGRAVAGHVWWSAAAVSIIGWLVATVFTISDLVRIADSSSRSASEPRHWSPPPAQKMPTDPWNLDKERERVEPLPPTTRPTRLSEVPPLYWDKERNRFRVDPPTPSSFRVRLPSTNP